jgi:hypothetical protein
MISVFENHTILYKSSHLLLEAKNTAYKQYVAQVEANELPIKPILYVNLQGQTIGSIINDTA